MNTEMRELTHDDLDAVSGGETRSYNLGGGVTVTVRFNMGGWNETCIGKNNAEKVCIPMPSNYDPPK